MQSEPDSTPKSVQERLLAFVRAHRMDLVFTAFALAVLSPTFWYRYGLDQSLYQYIGAGWMDGRLPYLRAFDVKPPGIYLVYGLSGLLFANAEAAIRISEALCILAAGWTLVHVVPRMARPDGLAGVACLLLAAWNATLFGFWDTGQVELWESCCLVFSFVGLARSERSSRSVFAGGAWLAGATLFKTTAGLAVVPLLAMVLRDTWKQPTGTRVRAVATFATGSAAPLAVVFVYFAARRGAGALVEWLMYLPHYARAPIDVGWVLKTGPEMLLARCGTWIGLLIVPIVAGIRADLRREDDSPKTACRAGYLLLAGAASIVLQRRFFSYHPVVLGPLLVLGATPGLATWLVRDRALVGIGTSAVIVGTFFSGPTWTGNDFMTYRSYVIDAWLPFVFGAKKREDFLRSFGGPFQYTYVANQSIASLIESRDPAPRDGLHVRGYDTTIYTLTGLYSPSRFFMEAPVGGYFAEYQPAWVAEHELVLHGDSAPRFFVTQTNADADIHALWEKGYGLVGARDRYVLLERGIRTEQLGAKEAVSVLAGNRLSGTLVGTIPFDLSFTHDGRFNGAIQGSPAEGTWSAADDGRICATLGTRTGCARLYASPGFVLAFDEAWREIAKIHSPRP